MPMTNLKKSECGEYVPDDPNTMCGSVLPALSITHRNDDWRDPEDRRAWWDAHKEMVYKRWMTRKNTVCNEAKKKIYSKCLFV